MDKKSFLSELEEKMRAAGVPEDYIGKHLDQFENYFDGKSDSQVEDEIKRLGDIDRVASRIKRMTDKKILSDSAVPVADDIIAESDADVITYDPKEDVKVQPELKTEKRDEENSELKKHLRSSKLDDEEIKNRNEKFRLLFILTLPLTLLVLLITALAFGAVFFVIAVLVIVTVAILAADIVAGTGLSAFGLIFGCVRCFASLTVGLYECGLSVMIGAAALFVGILLYNFAVRLLPYAAGKLLGLMKYVFRKYRVIYVYIKKEYMKL